MLKLTAATAYWRYKTMNKQKGQIGITVENFFKKIKCLHWFGHHEYIMDRYSTELPYFALKLINKVDCDEAHVWDINVKNTHSFIANGIMVHNCIEPYTANIYSRSTLAGDYYIINKYLMNDLIKLKLWDSYMVDLIKYYEGHIQNIVGIPDNIKQIYRTAWEIPQKSLIEMSADRGPFVDQTQSLNIFIEKPSFSRLNSCLFHGWSLGLKTGMYYLRSKSASEASQFGIDIDKIKEIEENNNMLNNLMKQMNLSLSDVGKNQPLECLSCGS